MSLLCRCLSISLSRFLSVCLCLPVYDCVSLCISIYHSVHPSVFLSVLLTFFLPSICLSIYPSLLICLPLLICLHLFLSLSIPFCLSVLIKRLYPLVTLVWRLFSSFLMRWTSVGRMLAVCSSSIQTLKAEWKISLHLLIGLTRVVYVPLTSICHL